MHRRQFIKATAGGGLLAIAAPAWSKHGLNTPKRPKVIFDARFKMARLFGDYARTHDATVSPFTGDATALWFEELSSAAECGLPLIGMTTGGVLFCLERLAAEHRMALVFHAIHPQASIEHTRISLGDSRLLVEARPNHLARAEPWVELAMRHALAPPYRRSVGNREHLHLAADSVPALESWVLVHRPSCSV